MVNPVRTWTIAINQALSNTNQLTQYREVIYAWKVNMLAAGWTVVRSSDGDAGAAAPGGGNVGAADNWTSAAVLGVDSVAGGGAWIVLQAPAAFTVAGGDCYVIASVDETDVVNPQVFEIRMSTATYTGGTTTSLPTTTGTETTNTSGTNILQPTAGTVEQNYATWYTSRGDVMFAVKRRGTNAFDSFFMLYSFQDDNGGGQEQWRWFLTDSFSAGAIALYSNFMSSSFSRSFRFDGTAQETAHDPTSVLSGITTRTLLFDNDIVIAPLHVFIDSATMRYLGEVIDVYTAPNSGTAVTHWGRLIDDETTQTYRRVCIGHFWVYAPTASLPFL